MLQRTQILYCFLVFTWFSEVTEESAYYVGVARTDVTGPIVQVNMVSDVTDREIFPRSDVFWRLDHSIFTTYLFQMGYAHPEQVAAGLHTRLYSRAYVIADTTMKNRVAFVSFDGGMTSQLLKLSVVQRLRKKYGDL